eukprot:3848333-Rhodomonas_salina.1
MAGGRELEPESEGRDGDWNWDNSESDNSESEPEQPRATAPQTLDSSAGLRASGLRLGPGGVQTLGAGQSQGARALGGGVSGAATGSQ